MIAGRRMQTLPNEPPFPYESSNHTGSRNLNKQQLGGVIFGCTHATIKECRLNQLFGLPAQHIMYVQSIEQGLPLFLFNYSDRMLHGIFEAASSGKMNINPYAWTNDGSEKTPYPAQVQVRVRLQCQPLPEDQFKPIIMDNYYSHRHFYFELDHFQASRLTSKLSALAIVPRAYAPRNTEGRGPFFRSLPYKREDNEASNTPALADDFTNSDDNEASLRSEEAAKKEMDFWYMKLKEMVLDRETEPATAKEKVVETDVSDDVNFDNEDEAADVAANQVIEIPTSDDVGAAVAANQVIEIPTSDDVDAAAAANIEKTNDKNESFNSSDHPSLVEQLLHRMEELNAFRTAYTQKVSTLEHKQAEAEQKIQQLERRYMLLESVSSPSTEHAIRMVDKSHNEIEPNISDSIMLVGGYDGVDWLSTLDLYSPSLDMVKSLEPMSCARSYASVSKLNGELYVFGGGNGSLWYDTVESYNPAKNQWTLRPSLNERKGSLAGATLGEKIFALGGGNGLECFSSVEMFDPYAERWIPTQSMLERRFALASANLYGAIYAVGGFDGSNYLKSAERFDPREHSWTKIKSMNTSRGCHSLIVMGEKLYALGGYDGATMVPSIEIYDPRFGKWTIGEPMDQPRGYLSAAVLNNSLYAFGGVKSGDEIVETVECYKEGGGWKTINSNPKIGRRCFSSTIVF